MEEFSNKFYRYAKANGRIKKLIEPFSKDRVQIIKRACEVLVEKFYYWTYQ